MDARRVVITKYLVSDREPCLSIHIYDLECILKTKISENERFCCMDPARQYFLQ